jgi:hypothetical protein
MVARARKNYVKELTPQEAREMLEEQSRRYLGVGLDEFVEKWFAGEYGDPDDNPDALELAVLLPVVGIDPWHHDKPAPPK